MKTCTKCKQLKNEIWFPKHNSYTDGYHSWCKSCKSEYSRSKKYIQVMIPFEVKQKFKEYCNQRTMAEVLREFIQKVVGDN